MRVASVNSWHDNGGGRTYQEARVSVSMLKIILYQVWSWFILVECWPDKFFVGLLGLVGQREGMPKEEGNKKVWLGFMLESSLIYARKIVYQLLTVMLLDWCIFIPCAAAKVSRKRPRAIMNQFIYGNQIIRMLTMDAVEKANIFVNKEFRQRRSKKKALQAATAAKRGFGATENS